jgi:hypothetical protein
MSRFDLMPAMDALTPDTNIGAAGTATSVEALGAGASTTRSSVNTGAATDIDLTAAKESILMILRHS